MAAIRALVVDDSAFMRKMIGEILRAEGIEVVATAGDGQQGLERWRELRPDVLTLDVEMPRMNGLECLSAIMAERPTPVVVLSSLAEAGSETAIRCLELGAVECVRKPSGGISLDIKDIGASIVAAVRAAAGVPAHRLRGSCRIPSLSPRRDSAPLPPAPIVGRSEPVVVVIASSTGGPGALQQVLPHLPADLGAGVLVVQHLPVGFSASLARRLDASSPLHVREAAQGELVSPGEALVAVAGRHLALDRLGRAALTDDPPLWGVRPSADVTLKAAVARYGERTIAVILTGMGRDAALGARAVHAAGGWCIAQDEASCVVYGMPRAAVEAGAVHEVLPISQIPAAIQSAVARVGQRRPLAASGSARSISGGC